MSFSCAVKLLVDEVETSALYTSSGASRHLPLKGKARRLLLRQVAISCCYRYFDPAANFCARSVSHWLRSCAYSSAPSGVAYTYWYL